MCGLRLESLAERRVHRQNLHQQRSEVCFWCYRQCSSRFKTEKHLFSHHRIRGVRCPRCNLELPGILHLHRHTQYVHPEETPQCSTCSRRFAARSSLVRHSFTCKERKKADLPLLAPLQLAPAVLVQDGVEDGAEECSSHPPITSRHTIPEPGDEKENDGGGGRNSSQNQKN